MPGIAASEPSCSIPLLASSSVAFSFIDTRCTPSPPLSCSLFLFICPPPSLSLSLGRYVPAGLAAMPMDYHGLSSRISLEIIRLYTRVRMYVRVTVCASVIRNPGERTYLSTGNKLTSCRKFANVPWEDSGNGRRGRRGGGEGEGDVSGGRKNKKRSFARCPEMRIRLGKTTKTFYLKFIIHVTAFCE